ncbi:hypothetical protein [Thermococcus sp.]|uniref:hypothetical protein n=1 Tax=Thermococcus sp. TaxID=35749 RepID=UPI002623D686|nr:hypothetical protein [Thermococcus sp.]
MKVKELLDMLDGTIADLKVAIVANQSRSFESPYTMLEFIQRANELQEDLDDLLKIRERLSSLNPEDDAEEHLSKEELEGLMKLMKLLESSKAHVY